MKWCKYGCLLFFALFFLQKQAHAQAAEHRLAIFKNVLFYGGWARLDTVPDVQDIGKQQASRVNTHVVTKKLEGQLLKEVGDSLIALVTVSASCDNYDRAGCIKIALVPKADSFYPREVKASVKRLEIGRFITPFMDVKKTSDSVPYIYYIDNIATILKDSQILKTYNIWMELEIFGRYSIMDCSPERSTFYGSLDLITKKTKARDPSGVLLITVAAQEHLNNFRPNGTDTLGKTIKTIHFFTKDTVYNPDIYLIATSHGADKNGEEYYVREHFLYLDHALVAAFKPNVGSCEPFRQYNTQPNNVYKKKPQSGFLWQHYSNWCPGSIVPTRVFPVGTLYPGSHSITISVPDAIFFKHDGDLPFSIYIEGNCRNIILPEVKGPERKQHEVELFSDINTNTVFIKTTDGIGSIQIYNAKGQLKWEGASKSIDVAKFEEGLYRIKICFTDNECVTKSFEYVKNKIGK